MPQVNPYQKYIKGEDRILQAIFQYMAYKHPGVWLFHPQNEGQRTSFERFKALKTGIRPGVPDIIIMCPRGPYCGLALELKLEKARIYKKNGQCATEHIARQCEWLDKFKECGFDSSFALGYDQAIYFIETYLGQK